jgi:hypothetical protein
MTVVTRVNVVLCDGADHREFEIARLHVPGYIQHGERVFYLSRMAGAKLVFERVAEVPRGARLGEDVLFIPASIEGKEPWRQANMATPEQIAAFRAGKLRAGKLGRSGAVGSYTRGQMNKTEARYAEYLELKRLGGFIRAWRFEPAKLRLAARTFLTPDFQVVYQDGAIEYHEVKGRRRDGRFYVREDAMLKLRFAAERYRQHCFVVVWPGRERGQWCSEHVRPHAGEGA